MRRLVGILVLALALVALAVPAAAAPTRRYPAGFERAFMSGCMHGHSNMRALCGCALRWLEQRYTYRRLVSIYRNDSRRFTRIAVAAVMSCRP